MPAQPTAYLGGSFAPPLTDDLLLRYRELVEALPKQTPLRDALESLLACCEQWWGLPDSQGTAIRDHPSGRGTIVPLDELIRDTLWNFVPWGWELDAYAKLFDGIDPKGDKGLRDAAHHLLWHAKELELNREPLTKDKL